jgi:hypothetical protein
MREHAAGVPLDLSNIDTGADNVMTPSEPRIAVWDHAMSRARDRPSCAKNS